MICPKCGDTVAVGHYKDGSKKEMCIGCNYERFIPKSSDE